MSTLKIILDTFRILNLPNKTPIFFILGLIILLAILEVVSLGLLLPVITNIIQDDRDFILFNFLKNYDLLLLLNIFFIFFIIKSLINIYLIKQIIIKNKITSDFISNYFKSILKKNLLFFKKNNSNLLIKNIITEAPEVINNIIYTTLMLITDIFIIFLIIIFIFFNFTSTTIYILPFFFLFYLIYLKFFKNLISKIGRERFNVMQKCIQYLSDGFGAMVDIKLSSSENKFQEIFRLGSKELYELNGKHAFFQVIPRYLMEISIILIFLFVFLIFGFYELNIKELLTFSSLLLVASLRIIPGLARIISSLQSIQYSYPSFIELEKQINHKNIDTISNDAITFKKSIKLKNLSFKYENSEITLNQINSEFNKGQIIGIIGKNGTGKSTLINIIMGLIKINPNMIFIDDKNISLQNINWFNKISYVSNQSFLLDTNIENNIAFEIEGTRIDQKRLKESIELLGYNEFLKEFPEGLKTNIGQNGAKISSGQKQKICLARAFYFNSEILIFDEATNSIDEVSEKNFFKKLSDIKKEKIIFIVSHDSKNLSLCDQIISLDIDK